MLPGEVENAKNFAGLAFPTALIEPLFEETPIGKAVDSVPENALVDVSVPSCDRRPSFLNAMQGMLRHLRDTP
jgi:hypothetical protein